MRRYGWRHCLLGTVLILTVLTGLIGSSLVMAVQDDGKVDLPTVTNQEQPQQITPSLTLETTYPVLTAKSGESFQFQVDVKYVGEKRLRFDIITRAPTDWTAGVTAQYGTSNIASIELQPVEGYPATQTLTVTFTPVSWKYPDAGDYVITLELGSGELRQTIELTARVTARYDAYLSTETGLLNIDATAGKDNHVSLKILNTGSASVDNINFTSSKPDGWTVTFKPEKIDSLGAGITQDVDVVIHPADKTIAGDWSVTLSADSKEISKSLDLRVTVLTPTIWGWVGIIIVVIVVAGVGVLFWRLGRR